MVTVDLSKTILRVKRKAYQLPCDSLTINMGKRHCMSSPGALPSIQSFRRIDKMDLGRMPMPNDRSRALKGMKSLNLSDSLSGSDDFGVMTSQPQGGTSCPIGYSFCDVGFSGPATFYDDACETDYYLPTHATQEPGREAASRSVDSSAINISYEDITHCRPAIPSAGRSLLDELSLFVAANPNETIDETQTGTESEYTYDPDEALLDDIQ